MSTPAPVPAVPRLTYLRIKNYRALRDVEFRDLTPLTVLIGPNGSGKSTVLDALDFLAEAVRGNLVQAWEKRDRFRGMRTRGEEGNIEFEVRARLSSVEVSYTIAFAEKPSATNEGISVENEFLELFDNSTSHTLPVFQLVSNDYAMRDGKQQLYGNKYSVRNRRKATIHTVLHYPLLQEVMEEHNVYRNEFEKIDFLASLIFSYRLFHLTDDHLKGYSDAGPREKLSPNGDNLPNVLYYLHEKHPETLAKITAQLRRWVPQLADVVTEITSDERLLLRFKDAAFEKPLPAQYMSGGTMRLASLLTLLYEPGAAGLLGMEEPDNELHPLLLYRLAEELGKASETRQLLVTTHSPMLLDALDPTQVWVLHRGADGYTQATRTADIPNVPELVEDGSPLGYLWTSNAFTVGNPLASFHPRPDAH
jgi:predicted ATPase